MLRRSNLLLRSSSGPNSLYVTEDFSRKVRLHREALVAFAKELRSKDPGARCMLQYDRLHAGGDVYLYNEIEGKVEKALMKKARGKTVAIRKKFFEQLFGCAYRNCWQHQVDQGKDRPDGRAFADLFIGRR